MNSQDKIKQTKNGRAARRINKLFGKRTYSTAEGGKFIDERFFDEMKLPKFYGSIEEIPSQTTGVFFVWDGAQVWYIDYSLRCVKTKIKKLFQANKGYVFSIAKFSHGDGSITKTLCRFLMELLHPVAQYKEPKEKVYNWEAIAKRFWVKVKIIPGKGIAPDDCDINNHAIWIGAKSNGYGVFSLRGKTTTAHRVAYILARGDIPDGAQVRKTCGSKLCCNPLHLRLVGVESKSQNPQMGRLRTAREIGVEKTRDRQALNLALLETNN